MPAWFFDETLLDDEDDHADVEFVLSQARLVAEAVCDEEDVWSGDR